MATQHSPALAAPRDAKPHLELLARDGFCVIPDLVPAADIGLLSADLDDRFAATPFCEGGFYGSRTKRFGSVLKRSPYAAALIQHKLILEIAQSILGPWCDTIQLNLAQALELHPGAPCQFPHRDQEMWRGPVGELEYLINVMWPFTEYRTDNGTTLIWPGSHGQRAVAEDHGIGPIAVECSPGAAVVFLGSTLHGAGANTTETIRRGMIVSYCLGWLKPYENQWLVYPPEIARGFEPALAALVGYQQHRPNLGNYEGRCPSILLNADPPDHLAATDALRPDQEEALAQYLLEQQRDPAPSLRNG